ncbi:hypothetical protein GCM10020001_089120 [Nonomuraea salmonea]
MGDEQQGRRDLGDQLQHLLLHGDVERGGGLVADEQPGVVGQGDGEHDALALAAGELVRERAGDLGGLGQAYPAEQVERPCAGLVAGAAVQRHDLGDLGADPHERVERGHRLLEDHGQLAPAQPLEPALRHAHQVVLAEPRRARGGDALGQQAHERQRGQRLARPRLADQPDPLARRDAERHVADELDVAGGDGEPLNAQH